MKKRLLFINFLAISILLSSSVFAVSSYKIESKEKLIIKRVPTEEQVVEDVVDLGVAAQTAVVTATQLTTTIAAAQNLNLSEYIKFFFSFFIARKGPKKDFWGLVYNSKNSSPIAFAVIRVVSLIDNKIIKTTVSDLDGRYGFILDPGKYRLEVEHQDFKFPVVDATAFALQNDNQVYRGDEISVSGVTNVNFNIPMESKEYKKGFSLKKLRKIWLNSGIVKLTQNMYFIYTLFVINILMVIDQFYWLFLASSIYYGIFVVIHLVAYFRKPSRTWGVVVDSKSNNPIPYAFVKVFNKTNGVLVDSKITDINGRFQFYPANGDYSLLVQAKGYKFPSEKVKLELKSPDIKILDFTVKNKSVNINIEIDPIGDTDLPQDIGTDKFAYSAINI